MEDNIVKVKKKNKTGQLKSTPGFLKCMRNVYLYFKEEKEKGALNIPINSFIERTAVACGVGRKTLYNYAKKGLFDEHPVILQPKQKRKKGKNSKKLKDESLGSAKKNKKKGLSGSETNSSTTPPTSPVFCKKASSPLERVAKNAMIQTDPRPINPVETLEIQESGNPGEPDGFAHFMIAREQKVQHLQVVQQPKSRESSHVLTGTWTTGATTTTIKRDEYFPKNNVWHAVYNLQTTEAQTCADLNVARIATCQQQPASDHLTNL